MYILFNELIEYIWKIYPVCLGKTIFEWMEAVDCERDSLPTWQVLEIVVWVNLHVMLVIVVWLWPFREVEFTVTIDQRGASVIPYLCCSHQRASRPEYLVLRFVFQPGRIICSWSKKKHYHAVMPASPSVLHSSIVLSECSCDDSFEHFFCCIMRCWFLCAVRSIGSGRTRIRCAA